VPQKQRSKVPAFPASEPELLVPKSQMDLELEAQITQGQELLEQTEAAMGQPLTGQPSEEIYRPLRDKYYTWNAYDEQLLRSRFSAVTLGNEYRGIIIGSGGEGDERQKLKELASDFNRKLRTLRSIRQRLSLFQAAEGLSTRDGSVTPHVGDRIFLVHGHDGDTKQHVAGFIEQITGERPIILHDQADSGRTVIEKFEEHAGEVGFAIILLTGDDDGQKKGADSANLRARQNVVFEFGYFMGNSAVTGLSPCMRLMWNCRRT